MRLAHCVNRALVAIVAALVGGWWAATGLLRRAACWRSNRSKPRLPLSAAGLVDVGTQPEGGLDGKDRVRAWRARLHGRRGDGDWSFQRGHCLGMIEDLGNSDQMTFLVDYLFAPGRRWCRCGRSAIKRTNSCSTTTTSR